MAAGRGLSSTASQAKAAAEIEVIGGTFAEAYASFDCDWQALQPELPEGAFDQWRRQRNWTAEKYRRFDRGERMPPDWQPSP